MTAWYSYKTNLKEQDPFEESVLDSTLDDRTFLRLLMAFANGLKLHVFQPRSNVAFLQPLLTTVLKGRNRHYFLTSIVDGIGYGRRNKLQVFLKPNQRTSA